MKKLTIFLLLLSFFTSYCQESNDTLKGESFVELRKLFYNSLENINLARDIAKYTLKKAKAEDNSKAISNSYFRIYATYFNDLENGKKYLDSSISISKKFKHFDLLAESYFYRGNLLSFHGQDQLYLDDYLKARKFAKKGSEIYYKIIYNIGVIKLRIDDNKAALKIFKECYAYDLQKGNEKSRKIDHLETLYGLSIAYVNNNILDSASIYTNEGYKIAKSLNDSIYLRFTYVEGNNEYVKGNLKNAKDSLLKSIPYLVKTNDYTNLSIAYSNLGNIYFETNRSKEMIKYFEKIDSIFDSKNYIYPTAISAYEKLIKYYGDKNDTESQVYYSKKLFTINSILKKKYKILSKSIYKDFDSQSILLEKEELENSFEKTNRLSFIIILITIIILIIAILLLIYYRTKQKKYKEKFIELVNDNKKQDNHIDTQHSQSILIDEKIIKSTLRNLEEFEGNLDFLNKGITLNTLAKQCNTNSKYLSRIINRYKKTSFRNYLNDLRIDYTVMRLKTDKKFQKYTVNAIADEVGFSNRESYAKAFQKRTGLHTSYFVKNLKKLNPKS